MKLSGKLFPQLFVTYRTEGVLEIHTIIMWNKAKQKKQHIAKQEH